MVIFSEIGGLSIVATGKNGVGEGPVYPNM